MLEVNLAVSKILIKQLSIVDAKATTTKYKKKKYSYRLLKKVKNDKNISMTNICLKVTFLDTGLNLFLLK